MHHLEILEGRKHRIVRKGALHQELVFAGVLKQPVACVDADLVAHRHYHPPDLALEVCGVVDDVEVGVAHPGGSRLGV